MMFSYGNFAWLVVNDRKVDVQKPKFGGIKA
jgi:hypothetical protein